MVRAVADPVESDRISSRIDAVVDEFGARLGTVDVDSLDKGDPTAGEVLSPGWEAALRYAAKLTLAPWTMTESDVAELRQHGLDDGEILEINQVVAYFAYANRTVQGLGATAEGEGLGYHPTATPDLESWDHR